MTVLAVFRASAFDAEMPAWEEMTLTWDELPSSRHAGATLRVAGDLLHLRHIGLKLRRFRLRRFESLGRWLGYAARGHGGNVLLRERDAKHFRFSILQRVSPDMDATDVIRLEASWKQRLERGTVWAERQLKAESRPPVPGVSRPTSVPSAKEWEIVPSGGGESHRTGDFSS